MMEHNTEKLLSAIGDVDAAYLEEALDFDAANAGRKRAARFPKLSAACVAVLVILGVSVTAFAVSRLPLSWRDIFSPEQTVIGDGDETPVISQQQPTAAAEELHIRVEKVISDERTLYLLYSVKANEGAVLDQSGQFADFELYFPGQMMSGAYVSSFLPRKEGVPENELEGVVYANWQPGSSANGLVMTFANWQEKRWFDHETIDFNVAEMVENAGENARLPQCQERSRNGTVRYYWQPGDADVQLPCGASICNAGWEDGVLQLVMKEPLGSDEWSASWETNWYFLDTRTDTVIYPESHCHFGQPNEFDPDATDADWRYLWRTWPLTRKRSPIWSCTGAERRSPPPCFRGTGRSRWTKHPSLCRARCWQRAFPSPMAGRRSRRRKSNAPSCPWRCTSPIMWTPPPAFSARSGYLTRMVRLSRAIGALSRSRPMTVAWSGRGSMSPWSRSASAS